MSESPVMPNFLIVGSGKCGTTTLWHYLRQHRDIFMPLEKEPGFFADRNDHARLLPEYQELFEDGRGKSAIGEGTPGYSHFWLTPGTPAAIARYIPDARLIYIVRHPLRRMESLWLHRLNRRLPTSLDFSEAVREVPEMIKGAQYYHVIETFRDHFPEEQILPLFLEDLAANPDEVIAKCDRFLGVDPEARGAYSRERRNVSAGKVMDRGVLGRIRDLRATAWFKAVAPDAAIRLARRLVVKPLPDRVEWTPETHRWACDQVIGSARQFLEYAGKPIDFWDFDEAG